MNAGLLRTVARRLRGHTEGVQPDADLLHRFVRERDERAFEELVRRHGPLVWGVCRRALANRADAEDAFQATFLVLAKDPRAVRKPAALGCWLHGVARRVAHRMRSRATLPSLSSEPAAADAGDQLTVREFLSALDDELGRLPDRVRGPLVLCFLQERTQDEAARQLGVSLSTLKRRLDAGRETLRDRLTRRGVDLSAALAGVGIAGAGASAAVTDATVRAAVGGAAGVVSAGVVTLAEGVIGTMAHTKLKVLAAGVMLATAAAGGTGYFAYAGGQEVGGTGTGQTAPGNPGPGGLGKLDLALPGPGEPPRGSPPALGNSPPVTILDRQILELEVQRYETTLAQSQKAIDAYAKQLDAIQDLSGSSKFERLGLEATIARLRLDAEDTKHRLRVSRLLLQAGANQPNPITAPPAADLKILELELRQAQAELEAAKANYEFSAKSFDRLRNLANTGTVGQREILQAEREMVQARSAVVIAEVKIEMAKHRLTVAADASKPAAQVKPTTPAQPVAPAAMSPEVRKLMEEMLKSAREAYKLDRMIREQGAAGRGPEEAQAFHDSAYRLSRRILELEQLLNPADKLKAAREHLDRMKDLNNRAAALAEAGTARPHMALEAKVYWLEAEVWVKEAEASPAPPRPAGPRGSGLPPNFRGTVQKYDQATALITLTPGLDAGVQKGSVMSVYQAASGSTYAGTYLGKLTVLSADPKQAVGRFTPADPRKALAAEDLPKAGDELKPADQP